MKHPEPLFLAFGVFMAALLSGCGGSSPTPPPPPSSPLSVSTSTLPQAVINVPYTATLSATGGTPPYAWNVASGTLNPGLSLSRAGVVSGTPTATGSSGFTVAVSDSEQPPSVAIAQLGITVNAALQVTTTSLPSGSPSVTYSSTLAALGGIAPYSWTITQGNLPNGLTLNATSGVISGTPTAPGTSSFTVQVTDSETPPATATANLSLVINPPPARSAALYTANNGLNFQFNGTGLQIHSDGSLTLLPSSPETAIIGPFFGPSPTLPLLFMPGSGSIESLLINPDYSLASYSSSGPLPGGTLVSPLPPSVDPTGSNVYLPGAIDSSGTTGVTIFPGNGSLQPLGTIAIPNINNQSSRLVFTPDGTLAFIATCPSPPTNGGSILSFSRNSDGTLTAGPVYTLPAEACADALAVSPDGRYLADSEVQVYSIASDGTLTAILPQPFTFTQEGDVLLSVLDVAWDPSGSYLFAAPVFNNGLEDLGGVAVLSFSGSDLTEIVPPTGDPVGRLQQEGSFIYGMGLCLRICPVTNIDGYNFQNGQLTPLPGSPYQYGNAGDMVIY